MTKKHHHQTHVHMFPNSDWCMESSNTTFFLLSSAHFKPVKKRMEKKELQKTYVLIFHFIINEMKAFQCFCFYTHLKQYDWKWKQTQRINHDIHETLGLIVHWSFGTWKDKECNRWEQNNRLPRLPHGLCQECVKESSIPLFDVWWVHIQ